MEIEKDQKILFYDGDCGFCNSSVQFVLSHKKNDIYFATLQSNFAQQTLNSKGIDIKLDTLYYLKNNTVYSKSSAGLQISNELKFPFPLFQLFYIVPPFIRDYFYTSIAKRRHKLKAGHCVIPSETDKIFFLTD